MYTRFLAYRRFSWQRWAALFVALLWIGRSSAATAYQPELETFWTWLHTQPVLEAPVVLKATTRFFAAPAAINAKSSSQKPVPLPRLSIGQTIYRRAGLLAIETTDAKKRLLHVYLQQNLSVSHRFLLTTSLTFRDIWPTWMPLLQRNRIAWLDEMQYWGVNPWYLTQEIHRSQTSYWLRENDYHGLLVDRKNFAPLQLHTHIVNAQQPIKVEIFFQSYRTLRSKGSNPSILHYPTKVLVYFNNQLVRQTIISQVKFADSNATWPESKWKAVLSSNKGSRTRTLQSWSTP